MSIPGLDLVNVLKLRILASPWCSKQQKQHQHISNPPGQTAAWTFQKHPADLRSLQGPYLECNRVCGAPDVWK